MAPRVSSNCYKFDPEIDQKLVQNSSKIDPEASWRALGAVLAGWGSLGGLLERSWRPPGPKKRSFERLLGAPRGISRQVSAILGTKSLPKRSPGGSKMGSQIESGLKRAKSQKMQYVLRENLNFESPGPPKTGPKRLQNWFPISSSTRKPSKSLLRASRWPLGPSWSALGALLDALIALLEPKTLPLSAESPH